MVTIGISTYTDVITWGVWRRRAAFLPETYLAFARAAGYRARLLAPGVAESPEAALEGCDALVLAGGPDVDPARYAAPRHPETGAPYVERDAWELGLLAVAVSASTPVLGVCRGMQLINVHFGGTLVQHLPDVVGHDGHRPRLGAFSQHAVHLAEGSALARALGPTVTVPTYHHQGVERLGDRLEAVGHADDGTVEALRHVDHPSLWGVQWHPEEDCEVDLLRAVVECGSRVAA